jgi:hypothetical protein
MRFSIQSIAPAWVVLVAFPMVSLLAAPPRVTETVPKNGDLNVDPALQEMRIVFDQDMAMGGFSLCGGGPTFPKIVGRPQWADKRTLVARIALEPDHEYRFSVNCPSATNCRSATGDPAMPYPITFRTKAAGGDATPPPTTPTVSNSEALRNLRQAIDERYSYRDLHRRDWATLFARYGPAMEKATSPAEFAQAAGELLANAKDMHIWLDAGGQTTYPFRRDITRNYNLAVLEKTVPGFRRVNDAICTGRFEDGIGYILIQSWATNHAESLKAAFAALAEFSDAPGLIVDVRPNGGGDEPSAQQFAGCFIDKPALYAKHVYRQADQPGGFGELRERTLQPSRDRPKYRGKVIVLMGQANMSSCEAFLLMMKQVPGCKLIGSTSYGSSGNPKPTDLGNGVTVYLPSWKAMLPDGTCFEGKGIKPDIPIQATPLVLEKADPVLQAALTLLRKR